MQNFGREMGLLARKRPGLRELRPKVRRKGVWVYKFLELPPTPEADPTRDSANQLPSANRHPDEHAKQRHVHIRELDRSIRANAADLGFFPDYIALAGAELAPKLGLAPSDACIGPSFSCLHMLHPPRRQEYGYSIAPSLDIYAIFLKAHKTVRSNAIGCVDSSRSSVPAPPLTRLRATGYDAASLHAWQRLVSDDSSSPRRYEYTTTMLIRHHQIPLG